MLARVLAAVRDAGRPVCAADLVARLAADLPIDESALEGMLDTLVARGRLRTIELDADTCSACPIRGGCFIMRDGLPRSYVIRLS